MSIFDDLWDTAKGVFKDVLDFKASELEFKLAKEAQAAEARRQEALAPSLGSLNLGSLGPALAIGAVAIGAVWLLKK